MRVRATKCEEDGVKFDSLMERDRYRELKILHRCGEIARLQCHPTFNLVVNDEHIAKYTPDFSYHQGTALVVEDVKGFKRSKKTGKLLPRVNREFGMKKKLMKAIFGIEVSVV